MRLLAGHVAHDANEHRAAWSAFSAVRASTASTVNRTITSTMTWGIFKRDTR